METFEFVVTSIARVALKEHVKIQAEGVEDAITRIEVTIHTLKGETVEVNGYFVQRDLNDNAFYLTDLDVVPND